MDNKYVQLIKKIKKDKMYYLQTFLKIRTKEGKLVSFSPNSAQLKSEQLIAEQRAKGKPVRVIWLKARQLGISTYCEGSIFYDTANNPLRQSLIIAHEDKATQNLFNMSKLFYEELPPIIRPMKKYSNESALAFENPTNNDDEKYKNPGLRSKITVATAKNVKTARSTMLHHVHASEVAFWDDAETLMTGLLQCIPNSPNTSVYIESTANGVGGWFYDFWKRTERGETDYVGIFLAWFDNPEYSMPFDSDTEKKAFIEQCTLSQDEAFKLKERFNLSWEQLNWRRWCIANNCNGDLDKFHQEYPSTPDEAFIASGRPKFDVNQLKRYMDKTTPPIARSYTELKNGRVSMINDAKGYVHIWQQPKPDEFYVIGADVAEGLATGDYSCGVVMNKDLEVCATWYGHIDPDLFGYELVKLAMYYNEAFVAVEANNHGLTTLKAIQRLEYWNIYYQKTYDKLADTYSTKLGFSTTHRTKPLIIDNMAMHIREGSVTMPWDTLVSECLTYVIEDNGSTNAQSGTHDDTVMATAIALHVVGEYQGHVNETESGDESLVNRQLIEIADEGGLDGDKIQENFTLNVSSDYNIEYT